ncbi:hypothetical protein [Pseudobacteriovorax antillogorgiicola]|uniref:Swiss Army Knife 2H phosphoesterase domain-containing protein n=1 Tax=Pseudobacteriovorax antillogorgiicola TaxID=1513793 RepID=A0A1Y6CIX6_9BACT|nr:hypothetical protein [Pseudobacteriovorax antillogorgiicola]TCS46998.1 hypothetical protein EDD56_12293 [Pseudobacteriovorax antillogorgiicola]SMF64926.1 hypothetical protein SAMN06296036_12293 [Pseudobacteriovorax antillogorgiicola]
MNRLSILGTLLSLASSCAATQKSELKANHTINLDRRLYQGETVPFIPHQGSGPFSNYLAMNLPFDGVPSISHQIKQDTGDQLKDRGEAHITVLTPPEYKAIEGFLKRHGGSDPDSTLIARINEIALESNIQSTRFNINCVGRAQKSISGRLEATYFLVVDAPALFELRKSIFNLVVEEFPDRASDKGFFEELREGFDPKSFHPHITIGFTKRDLHLSDGAVKDQSSCLYSVR